MTILATLFFGRVLGQLIVSRRSVRFLPPMEQWQSGLLPYPILLLAQVVILVFQATTIAEARRGQGTLIAPRPKVGRVLRLFSIAYFSSMVVRYVVSMARHPERRWFGKTIPVWFHCVLATYLYLYSRLLRRPGHG